jgi:LAS superfamily LD-carboxypeptidase LdcB
MLTGRSEQHLCGPADAERLGARVHQDVVAPFERLRDEAARAGFDLRILSGFRSFDEQLSIWNRKAGGQRAVLDSDAVPLDIATLSPRDLVFAILRWSALPGASRHHWGTDLDVYDEAARPAGYEVDLIPAEVNPGGMFGPLHAWLDERVAAGTAHGFFRPYDRDRGGVAPERWHLSHAPTAAPLLAGLTTDVLQASVRQADMRLRDEVLEHLEEIVRRFVVNISRPAA